MKASGKIVIKQPVLRLCMGIAAIVLVGCKVGPDHAPPERSVSPAWHSELEGGLTDEPMDPKTLASWWTTLDG